MLPVHLPAICLFLFHNRSCSLDLPHLIVCVSMQPVLVFIQMRVWLENRNLPDDVAQGAKKMIAPEAAANLEVAALSTTESSSEHNNSVFLSSGEEGSSSC